MRIRRVILGVTATLGQACGDDGAVGSGSDSGAATQPTTEGSDTGVDDTSDTGASPIVCEVIDPLIDATPGAQPNPTVRRTVSGGNGDFTDECDPLGNLIEYVCETVTECGPGPNPACTESQTGAVVPTAFDCAGTCSSGTCVGRCPAEGDLVEYTAISGDTASFRNLTDERLYDCMLSFDQSSDTYECSLDPAVGETTVIFGLGLMSTWCTGTQTFNIATGDPQQCTYMCEMVPETGG